MGTPESIEFHTANTAATHLGRKLYTSSPSALAELIANSYDAYAENVWVKLTPRSERIVIADDGIGMSVDAVKKQYASIGQPKKPTQAPHGKPERKPMGKKGIGKLASFSLGGEFTVYTKTQDEDSWFTFTLSYEKMVSTENSETYTTPANFLDTLPEEFAALGIKSGFIVVIEDLRRQIRQVTIDNLKVQLTRRFSIRNSEIKIIVNEDVVDLSPFELLYTHIQAVNYVGYEEKEIREMFPKAREILEYQPSHQRTKIARDGLEQYNQNGVKAWLGVVDKPKRLTDLGLGGVLVYINGKVADEDLLKSNKSAQMGGQYVTGEMSADFLNEESEDPITSSRQGLDQSDENVDNLIKLAQAMQNKAIEQWDRLKEKEAKSRLPEQVRNDERYAKWENSLSSLQKKFNGRLLRILSQFEDFDNEEWMSDEEKIAFLNSTTTLVQSLELQEISHELPDSANDEHQLISLVTRYLGNIARQDRWQMADTSAKRLNAIKQLNELIDKENEVENAFEECLFDNPWLLNPFWNRTTSSDEHVAMKRQHFTKIRDEFDNDHKRGFIDIYVEVAEEDLPVVVELKRHDGSGHSSPKKVTYTNILEQINLYRKGLYSRMPAEKQGKYKWPDIKAIFVAPKNSLQLDSSYSGLDRNEVDQLAQQKIEVTTYEALLDRAYTSYQDFFQSQKESAALPYFRFGLDENSSI
ncbi:ATP-binding protein [Corynebacterium sp. HMSC059E07]|uniref:ATP-binding protein n=1 Tax=Corynebacterium sp. HMSC059E07 TaxID=1739471 RepID=UPI0008BE50DC|nr:ATP-binding protein [Corynebacterium sp. HMSC059E07]OFP88295.1 hypothetical protein HMPREF2967_07750 [Corynebacterium sp. HMSC059E07]